MTDAERALLRTIHYFDLFSYPLTAFEAWKWYLPDRPIAARQDEIRQGLHTLERQGRLEQKEGFFFLHGHNEIVSERKRRYRIAEKKFSKVLRVVRLLRFLPFLRAIAVCNSLAYANARVVSDLDVVIVTAPKHMWTARFFSAGLLALLNLRPTTATSADRICLSFFLARPDADLSKLLLPGGDPYFAYWLDMLVPVFGDPKQFDLLRSANPWHRLQLPNAFGNGGSNRRRVADTAVSKTVRTLFEACVERMESVLRRWQMNHFPSEISSIMNRGSSVVVSDEILKFHPNDRRQFFADRFLTRCAHEGL